MKARFKISLFCIFLMTAWFTPLHSQQVSAEYISSHTPAKLSSGEQVWDGIQNILINKDRLYVVDVWAGLQILDVSNVYKPKELGAFTTDQRAQNVFVDDHYAYLATTMGGVQLLDVSDPAHIKKAGTIKTEGDAYWVVADYPRVYVAEAKKGLGVYDVSEVDKIYTVAHIATNGWAWSLFLDGKKLYVGDKKSGLIILDVTNTIDIKTLGRYTGTKDIKTLFVENKLAYIADGPGGFLIIDVANPASPKLVGKLKVDGYIYDAHKSGNSVFLANDRKQRLDIVNVSDPHNPRLEGSYQTKKKIFSALKKDVYVFVAADSATMILRYNRPPQLANIEDQQVNENEAFTIQAFGSDPDNDAIEYAFDNLPAGATFDSLSGLFSWTPSFEQSGVYKNLKITVTEKTASALSASDEFKITVNHVNRNPSLPELENYQIDENKMLAFTIPEGSDPDKEDQGKLTYEVQNLPPGAEFNPQTRQFSWTPSFEQSGVYNLSFSVQDPAGGSDSKTSVITVRHIDRKPVLAEVGPQSVAENATLTFTLKGSDADKEDQTALSYRAFNLPKGALFDPATATFSWSPTFEQSGTYKNLLFVFTAGAMKDSVSVDVTVNHVNRRPKLNTLKDQTVDEDKLLAFTINGTDDDAEDQGKLVYSAANLPQGAKFNPDSARFSWKPTFEQSGVYKNVIFMIQDAAGLKDSSVISITVNHVNRAPALAVIEPKVADENTNLAFDLKGSDPDAEDQGKLTYTAKGLPEGAKLEGNHFSWTPTYDQSGQYSVTFTVSDGQFTDSKEAKITVNHVNRPPQIAGIAAQEVDENKVLTFKISGSDPDKEDDGKWKFTAGGLPDSALFDTTTNTFSWKPSYEQSGKYTVKFTLTDPAGLSDEKTTEITVNHINRAPRLPDQPAQAVDENQTLNFTLLPAVDPDKEDQGKIVYTAKNLPQGATFDPAGRQFNWTPTFEQSGEYKVTFSVTDGQYSDSKDVNISVKHVNRAPQIVQPAAQAVDENKPWQLKIEYADPDKEDQGKLKIAVANKPEKMQFDESKALFSWKPGFEDSGNYENIKLSVTDPAGLSDEKTFSLVVNHVNRAPVLQAVAPLKAKENEAIAFNLQATDPDKEDDGKLSYSCDNLPQGASLSSDGAFSWRPLFTQAGAYTLHFKVTDSGKLSDTKEGKITVADVNRAPVLQEPGSKTVKENEEVSFTLQATDEDTDNTMKYSAQNLPQGASFDAASGHFSWKPGFDQAGDYSVTFMVSDGKEEKTVSADIKVQNVNRKPQISGPSSEEVQEGQSVSLSYSATDADNDELTFSADGLPSGASIDSRSGSLSWQTSEGQAGSYSITVKVSDGTDEAGTSTTITVTPKPAPAPPDSTQH